MASLFGSAAVDQFLQAMIIVGFDGWSSSDCDGCYGLM